VSLELLKRERGKKGVVEAHHKRKKKEDTCWKETWMTIYEQQLGTKFDQCQVEVASSFVPNWGTT
jgi:hypothetical protein